VGNESFDRVFCINAFHHFQGKVVFLTEAMRVLRPGGLMMIVGLDPHTGVDQWYIYEYFANVLEIDRRRYPASSQIREWMQAAGFADCVTREIQHLPVRLGARAALEQGRLDKSVTSQLSVLTDEEYRQGVARVRQAVAAAEARGESLYLSHVQRCAFTSQGNRWRLTSGCTCRRPRQDPVARTDWSAAAASEPPSLGFLSDG
jgi:SAM-dependent methyltransferase